MAVFTIRHLQACLAMAQAGSAAQLFCAAGKILKTEFDATGIAFFIPLPKSGQVEVHPHRPKPGKPRILAASRAAEGWLPLEPAATARTLAPSKSLFPAPLPLAQGHYLRAGMPAQGRQRLIAQITRPLSSRPFTPEQLKHFKLWVRIIGLALEKIKLPESQSAFQAELEREIGEITLQLRKANVSLHQADQAKSESISVIAHELRTPITTIAGFARLLMGGQAGGFNQEQKQYFEIIHRNADYMVRLISDLLDLTKLELDKMEMRLAAVPVRDLLHEAALAVQGVNPEETGRIQLEMPPREMIVQGDRMRLLQVLANLLSNALKYAPPGTPIRLRTAEENGHAVFEVEDQGRALSPEECRQVFEKFFRLKAASDSKIPGSGLGLAVSQNIVRAHGGTVWCEPSTRGGNIFGFRLPLSA